MNQHLQDIRQLMSARLVVTLLTGVVVVACGAEKPAGNASFTPLGDATTGGASGGTTGDDGLSGVDGASNGGDGSVGSGSDGSKGSGTTQTPAAKHVGYPSHELRLRIVGPSGRKHTVVSGGVVDIAGVLFGNADEITWKHSNGAEGKAYGAPFFQTGKIELTPGDNKIVVTARKDTATTYDTITITYNPLFRFTDRIRVGPRVIKTGKSTQVLAVVSLGKTKNFIKGSLKVFRTDNSGNKLKSFGSMLDDGKLYSSGDEIKGDGNYSRKFIISDSTPGIVRIRASVLFQVGAKKYAAYTDVAEINIVNNISSSECLGMKSLLENAKTAAKKGTDAAAARTAALGVLKASNIVSATGSATAGGSGVWVQFKSGILAAINLNPAGSRGGAPGSHSLEQLNGGNAAISAVRVQSKQALLLNPFRSEFGPNEIDAGGKMIKQTACPAYEMPSIGTTTSETGPLVGAEATLNYYRHFYEYGIIAMATHGDALFSEFNAEQRKRYGFSATGSQEVLWTGHAISCNYFNSAGSTRTCSEKKGCGPESECFINSAGGKGVCVDHLTADLRHGRVILGADGVYGITPAFIPRHAARSYPRSLVYLGACRSLFGGSLAAEFFAAGAAAVVGFNGNVSNDFATKWGTTFIQNVIGQKQLSGVAHVQIEDTSFPGTFFRLVGAQNLDAYFSDLLNPSWETGNVAGWIRSGDGRVIAKLGGTVPVGGKFMGVVSTGLGYTTTTGELRQRFCVQPGRQKMTFWWRFYSEEFVEFCGSKFQDSFRAELVANAGKKTIVNVKVDDLCPKNTCKGKNTCGGQYKGLSKADVSFDRNGVYVTPWVKAEVDVGPFAGNGNVNLRLFTADKGDSAYDTAILIDKISIQ